MERLSKELGVCRSALLGLYSDRKSRQHVEKCTDRVINELKSYEDVGSIDISTIEVSSSHSVDFISVSQSTPFLIWATSMAII